MITEKATTFKPENPNEALFKAIDENNLDAFEEAFSKRVSLKTIDQDGMSALMHAIRHPDLKIAAELLNLGANVDLITIHGTALTVAAKDNNVEAISLLKKFGANVNYECYYNNHSSPLSQAIKSGSVEAVEKLLELGADINLPSVTAAVETLRTSAADTNDKTIMPQILQLLEEAMGQQAEHHTADTTATTTGDHSENYHNTDSNC